MKRHLGAPPACQVRVLAELKRASQAHAGRIVLIEGPAATIGAPEQAFRLLASRVMTMGRDLHLDCREVRDLVVADFCL